jgi:hypothetical protein
VTFDPIQNSTAERPQHLHIFGEEGQTDWNHPESQNWQESKNASKGQQCADWNPEPPTGWPPKKTNHLANALRQPIYDSPEAPVIGTHCRFPTFFDGTAFG